MSFFSNTAENIANRCVRIHESDHKNDPNMICNEDGWLEFPDTATQNDGEIAAYKKEIQCYQDAKAECGLNPFCRLEVWGHQSSAETMRGRYERLRSAL